MAALLNWEVMRPHTKPENPVQFGKCCIGLNLLGCEMPILAKNKSQKHYGSSDLNSLAMPIRLWPRLRVCESSQVDLWLSCKGA